MTYTKVRCKVIYPDGTFKIRTHIEKNYNEWVFKRFLHEESAQLGLDSIQAIEILATEPYIQKRLGHFRCNNIPSNAKK